MEKWKRETDDDFTSEAIINYSLELHLTKIGEMRCTGRNNREENRITALRHQLKQFIKSYLIQFNSILFMKYLLQHKVSL